MPDERTRVLRRRLSRRARTRSKNEVHAVLMRRLVGRCPHSDTFGRAGRNWLRSLELAVEESETVEAAMRHIEFLDAEIAEIEGLIARDILGLGVTRTLMSVPITQWVTEQRLGEPGTGRPHHGPRRLTADPGTASRARLCCGGRVPPKPGASAEVRLRRCSSSLGIRRLKR
jgi:hypothetical protein